MDFVVVGKKFWNDNYSFEVELLQHFLQLRYVGRMLCKSGLKYFSYCTVHKDKFLYEFQHCSLIKSWLSRL